MQNNTTQLLTGKRPQQYVLELRRNELGGMIFKLIQKNPLNIIEWRLFIFNVICLRSGSYTANPDSSKETPLVKSFGVSLLFGMKFDK